MGPSTLVLLLRAPDAAQSDNAWDAFLSSHGHLLLRTAKYTHRDHDAAMDAYSYVLEQLRRDNFKRLRAYNGNDSDHLNRWLVVVARRLCLDFRRQRYGRNRDATPDIEREARRRLVDKLWDPQDPAELPGSKDSNPEWHLRNQEWQQALAEVLEQLEPRDQLLLALRFENGLSARRIAGIMHWPSTFHVYRRLNKLLPELRSRLRERGVEDPTP